MVEGLLRIVVRFWGLLLLAVVVVLALVVKLVVWPFEKPMRRSREEVLAILERRLSDNPDWSEWDEFTCVPIADPALEAIRKECLAVEQHDPSHEARSFLGKEAHERLRALADGLRAT